MTQEHSSVDGGPTGPGMVERVAIAIAKAQFPGLMWPSQHDPEYMQVAHKFLPASRAAIEAMKPWLSDDAPTNS